MPNTEGSDPFAHVDLDFGEKAVATCSGDLFDNVVATSRVRRTWMGRALGVLRR